MKREMLVEVQTIREQTRGELGGAAIQMKTLQEAMTNQQAKMMRTMKEKEKRKKPDTDMELEDDPL